MKTRSHPSCGPVCCQCLQKLYVGQSAMYITAVLWVSWTEESHIPSASIKTTCRTITHVHHTYPEGLLAATVQHFINVYQSSELDNEPCNTTATLSASWLHIPTFCQHLSNSKRCAGQSAKYITDISWVP